MKFGSLMVLESICCTQNCRKIGQGKAKALLLFHVITGCDTVSFFGGKGEKTAWDVWNVYPVLTNVLCRLMLFPEKVEDTFMAVIERFVALLYNRTSAIVEVNPARKDLFLKKAKSLQWKNSHQHKQNWSNTQSKHFFKEHTSGVKCS